MLLNLLKTETAKLKGILRRNVTQSLMNSGMRSGRSMTHDFGMIKGGPHYDWCLETQNGRYHTRNMHF